MAQAGTFCKDFLPGIYCCSSSMQAGIENSPLYWFELSASIAELRCL